MENLVVILARKNSKRLKNKNILKIKKQSLIERCINFAKRIPKSKIIVSTDSIKILNIALKKKVLAPWLRPAKLAQDDSSSESATLHALRWCEKKFGKFNSLLLLQPTTPFRSLKILKNTLRLFKKNKGKKNFISISKNISPSKNMLIGKTTKSVGVKLSKIRKERDYNDLTDKFYINGSFYIISPKEIKKTKSFFTKNSIGIRIFKKKEMVDIDTKADLKLARGFK